MVTLIVVSLNVTHVISDVLLVKMLRNVLNVPEIEKIHQIVTNVLQDIMMILHLPIVKFVLIIIPTVLNVTMMNVQLVQH